jgi:hypothetical protein
MNSHLLNSILEMNSHLLDIAHCDQNLPKLPNQHYPCQEEVKFINLHQLTQHHLCEIHQSLNIIPCHKIHLNITGKVEYVSWHCLEVFQIWRTCREINWLLIPNTLQHANFTTLLQCNKTNIKLRPTNDTIFKVIVDP